jgi:chromosome segregation ATPase
MEERLEAVLAHNARLERKLQEAEANATADDIRARLQRAKRENANLQAAMVKLQRDFDQLDTEWEAKLAAVRAEYDEKLREQQTLIFHAEQTKLTYAEEQNAGLRKRVEEAEASAAAAQKEAAQAMSSLSERDLQLARETRRHEEWAQSMSLRAQALEKESNELRFRLQTAQADREYHSRAQEVERMNEAALIAADVEGSNTTAREEAEYEALVRNLRLQVSRLETRLADSEAHLAAERKLHSEFAASMEKKAKERDRQDELLRQSLEEKNQALMRRVQESEKQLHAVMEQARREREQHIINLKKLESDFKSNTLRGAPRRLREDGTGPGEPATVVKEFTGGVRDDDELPLAKGDKVLVLKKSGGWWRGRKVKEGWFPSSYVKLTTQDQNQFTLLQLRAVLAETEAVAPINGIVFCSVDKWPT